MGSLAATFPLPAPTALVEARPLREVGSRVSGIDSARLGEVFASHGPAVYRRALRLLGNAADAEEATQEIFLRALRGAPAFGQRSQLTTWLYQITTNYCLNHLRDGKQRGALAERHLPKAEPEAAHGGDELLLLRQLFASADEREAAAAVYVYLDGMSHDEAAELLGVSRRTVGNLLERFSAKAALVSKEPAP